MKARGPAVAILAGIVSAACAVDLAGRSMARASWMARIGIDVSAQWVVLLALVATALMLGGLAARRQLTPNRAVLAALAFAFAAGMAAQLHLAEDAFTMHLLLQRLQRLVDIVVANDDLQRKLLPGTKAAVDIRRVLACKPLHLVEIGDEATLISPVMFSICSLLAGRLPDTRGGEG